jgi:hypothetical protein
LHFTAAWGYADPLEAAKLRTNRLERWDTKKEANLRMAGPKALAAVFPMKVRWAVPTLYFGRRPQSFWLRAES